MNRLYIIRHGNNFGPGEQPLRVGARTDLPLAQSGRDQAVALAQAFKALDVPVDRIIASPLKRAQETARPIAAAFGQSIITDETGHWLTEIDHGPDEGQPEENVRARLGDAALVRWSAAGIPPADWHVDAEARTEAWKFQLTNLRGVTLCVTSNGAARFALAALIALQPTIQLPASRGLRTGSYGMVQRTEDGRFDIAAWDIPPA